MILQNDSETYYKQNNKLFLLRFQLRQYEESVQTLHEKIDKLLDQRTVTETIDDKLRSLVCEIASMKSCYYTSNTMFHDFEKKLTSIKSNLHLTIYWYTLFLL